MANSNSETGNETARKTRKKPLDLATAKVADGALPAPRSIADIIGGGRSKYDTRDFSTYKRRIASMELYQLQKHSKDLGILPAMNKPQTIKRLEEAFLIDQRRSSRTARVDNVSNDENDERAMIRQRADAILRGERVTPL